MRTYAALLAALFVLPAISGEILNRSFNSPDDMANLTQDKAEFVKMVSLEDGKLALEIALPANSEKMVNCVRIPIPRKGFCGRRIVITADFKIDLDLPVKKWGGAEFVFYGEPEKGKKGIWKHTYIGYGKRGWKTYRLETEVPAWIQKGYVRLGIVNAPGKVWVRNVKATADDMALYLDDAVNMGFADEIAGDHKGGWHDQGPRLDAAKFPIALKKFANVPFRIINPKLNDGKSIIVFECPRLPNGPKEVNVSLPVPTEGKYMYLLHCSAWGQKEGTSVGTIDLTNTAGKKVSLPVIFKRDLSDWFGAKPAPNAIVGTKIQAQGGIGAAYVSRFDIPEGFGAIAKVDFRKTPGATVMWMLIGATISDTKYAVPEAKALEVVENDIWKPLPQSILPSVKAGTALDLSPLFSNGKIGEYGRIVCGKSGHFEFEKRPGVPVRFHSFCMNREFFQNSTELKNHKDVENYADQVQRAGYNLVRMGPGRMREVKWRTLKAFEYDPVLLDLVDYLVFCLRERGIYINYSVFDPTIGFDYLYPWGKKLSETGWNIFLNKRDFDAWKRNAEFLLTRVNPYTKTRMVDDPQFAVIDTCNEMDTKNTHADNRYAPAFREFLKRKYSSFTALKTAWGADAEKLAGFDDIKTFLPVGKDVPGTRSRDSAEFITELERTFYRNGRAFIRSLGYKGPVTGYLAQVSMRLTAGVRSELDFVSKNGYHDHPMGGMKRNAQSSSIENVANMMRGFLSTRLYGKPLIVSEHAHSYWNHWRYEQGFVTGGFSALNAFDALTAYSMPVSNRPLAKIVDFEVRFDPIRRACELMIALLYRREDVKTSNITTRVQMNYDEVVRSNVAAETINTSQLRMGLLGKCFVDTSSLPAGKNEIVMQRSGSSAVNTQLMFTGIVDSPTSAFDMNKTVKMLKERKLIPQSNRTDSENERFESSTGELFLECAKKRMTINTARFQGLCSPSGGSAKLPNFEILKMNRNASIALASVDGDRALKDANRMLLFIVTNALNSGTVFEEEDQRVRLKFGDLPILLETGLFTVAIRTPHIASMKAYALGLDGSRLAELPLRKIADGVELTVDTAKIPNGPSVFFELTK